MDRLYIYIMLRACSPLTVVAPIRFFSLTLDDV